MPQPLLIGVVEAMQWTGRPSATLRRWVHEGRITRYGTARCALFDWHELPEKSSGQPAPARKILDTVTCGEP